MTNVRVTVSLLFLLILVGCIGNLFQVLTAFGDWRWAHRNHVNGPRIILVKAELRRHFNRLLMQFGMLWIASPRTLFDQQVAMAGAALVYFVLAVLLTLDTIFDAIDRQELKWFLRSGKDEHYSSQ